jgi:myo-inositol-1(or 4)-monophosphatase
VAALADRLATGLRELVRPQLGEASARRLTGVAVGGDATFDIDSRAEAFVSEFLEETGAPMAVYSEDRGLTRYPTGRDDCITCCAPKYVLIVDPIDGTRPAAAGLEAACVSIAVAAWTAEPTMADVLYGVIYEIKGDGRFRARRGGGAEIECAGAACAPRLSENVDLDHLFWTLGFRGRPARELIAVLGGLVDRSSVNGGVFDLGSATFGMTRILTGQMDAYIDVGPRMIELAPWMEQRFREVGLGHVLNNSPHDVAAAALILEEAGCPVTDAAGRPLAGQRLLGSGMSHQMSVVASSSPGLQTAILAEVERAMLQFVTQGPGSPCGDRSA